MSKVNVGFTYEEQENQITKFVTSMGELKTLGQRVGSGLAYYGMPGACPKPDGSGEFLTKFFAQLPQKNQGSFRSWIVALWPYVWVEKSAKTAGKFKFNAARFAELGGDADIVYSNAQVANRWWDFEKPKATVKALTDAELQQHFQKKLDKLLTAATEAEVSLVLPKSDPEEHLYPITFEELIVFIKKVDVTQLTAFEKETFDAMLAVATTCDMKKVA